MTPDGPLALLRAWLKRQLDAEANRWLEEQFEKLGRGDADRDLYLAIGLAPRKLGKTDLTLGADDLAAAKKARPGWSPEGWSVDQAARIAMLLIVSRNADSFPRRLDDLCSTADVRELIAFYRGLALYPGPERFVARAAEGARTNMKAVFEAVAHRNPYPAEQFEDHAWNHMVLKAVFVGSALHPIQRFDERRNAALASTLIDYVHERWAAGRAVTPELWRGVGPFADKRAIEDLGKVLAGADEAGRAAAALALRECPRPEAKALIATVPELASDIDAGRVSWDTVYRDILKQQEQQE